MKPFLGLRPFEADEEYLFFGRETQVSDLLGRLRSHQMIAIVGTSGSGKSSLVRAGLLPALYGGFLAGRGSQWRVAVMRPGGHAVENLAAALSPGSGLDAGLTRAVLERGALGLVEVVHQWRPRDDENVLIVVDQFEELFRFARREDGVATEAAAAFVNLLLAAAKSTLPIYVVLTMRSDFIGDCERFPGLPETINDGMFLVPRMTRDQLRLAIEGPVAVAGAQITPRLVNRLLNDVGDDPDQLPVLSHVLMRMWNIWEADHAPNEPLDLQHYESTGGMKDALSRHGDEVYASLDPPSMRELAEKTFKALTEQGPDNRGIRRPTRFDDLCKITGAEPEQVSYVLNAFRAEGVSFLTPRAAIHIDDNTVIDIVHESLMRIWERLAKWVADEAQSASIYRRVAEAAALREKGNAALWRDPDLAIALDWRRREAPNATWAERYAPDYDATMKFLDQSVQARSNEQRTRRRRVRTTIASLALAVAALGALLVFAFAEWRVADAQLRVANAENMAAKSLQSEQQSYFGQVALGPWVRGSLLALRAYAIADTPTTEGALLTHLQDFSDGRRAILVSVFPFNFNAGAALSNDAMLVPTRAGLTAYPIDAAHNRTMEWNLGENVDAVTDSGDGTFAVSWSAARRTVRVLDIANLRVLSSFLIADPRNIRYGLAYDPRSRIVSMLSKAGAVTRLTVKGKKIEATRPLPYAGCTPDKAFFSTRGNFLWCNRVVVSTDGRFHTRVGGVFGLTNDERYIVAQRPGDPWTHFLTISGRDAFPNLDLVASNLIAMSPNYKTVAYITRLDVHRRGIQLMDVRSNTRIGDLLPSPPGAPESHCWATITFTADGRHLLVPYSTGDCVPGSLFTAHGWRAASYDVDPRDWKDALCRLIRLKSPTTHNDSSCGEMRSFSGANGTQPSGGQQQVLSALLHYARVSLVTIY